MPQIGALFSQFSAGVIVMYINDNMWGFAGACPLNIFERDYPLRHGLIWGMSPVHVVVQVQGPFWPT